ncbi:hypothetical protein PMZ80_005647 [Knufia obscura]|uniref:Inositol polyphosphate-related phosphatase domain-containing protein n=1 Tax=Knufia obscura TaxID=1635080 RepID=A0ABR0RM66_9EURO|nr:hypothetical protein PMZ80_005647 [Knufia obscura]
MSLKPIITHRPHWSSHDPWSPIDPPRPPGAYPPSPNPSLSPKGGYIGSIANAVKARKDEYVRKKRIKVKVGTWNVAALADTRKDLGGWFAHGLGVRGLNQDLAGLDAGNNSSDALSSDSEVEGVEEQEARHRKKSSTLPRHDHAAVPSDKDVDLYVLGLQEVIDVSSVTEAMKPFTDPNPAKRWKNKLKKALPPGYKKVVEHQLIGLLLLVYASPQLAPEVSSVDATSVGTGLMGYLGNKGAVSARILVGETTRMLFVNCHLAAGADATALQRRISDTQQIISRTKFHPVGEEWVGGIGQSEQIGDEDIAFWFGDLNYRLDDIPGEDVRRLLLLHARNEYDILNVSKRRIDSELQGYLPPNGDNTVHSTNHYEQSEVELPAAESSAEPPLDPENDPASLQTTLKSLFTHDQLRAQQRMRKAFHDGWREGEVNFLPTYKYDVGSVAMFDSGEKKRSPSWCDRILYRTRADYEAYHRRVKQETEARKKDHEMKKRGLDDAASQEDVLFDYDPENDADECDDQVEQHDNDGDLELVRTKEGFEDTIQLDEYISHQRVLSSDHKPLTAVFTLTYDSVDHTLKAKVQQQVTRDFDKAENEARPAVTLVLDNHTHSACLADRSSDALDTIDFGEVRYHVQYDHHLTIANTGPIEVTYAFVNRPVEGAIASPFPSWLSVKVHQKADTSKVGPRDVDTATRYTLNPGETTNIDLLVEIVDADMVRRLNSGEAALDDVLVLRIANGRDYFISLTGSWLQTCFHRSVDELVKVPSGVRSLTMKNKHVETQRHSPAVAVHSAPQEIFAMTDMIPKLVERVAADWDMLHEDEEPPWKAMDGSPWPFDRRDVNCDPIMKDERLAEIREALDKAESLDEHLSPCTNPAERLELLSQTLLDFLASLSDGIIVSSVWQEIESNIQMHERSKTELTSDLVQEIVMEAISSTPVHSVSLTFITFMLNRIINGLCADSLQQARSADAPVGRSRSSTSASAMSNVSLSSVKSGSSSQTKRSFLPSLTRRTTNSSTSTTPMTPTAVASDALPVQKAHLAHRYAEAFAPILIKSDDAKTKAKDRKAQLTRKVKALESFLNQEP